MTIRDTCDYKSQVHMCAIHRRSRQC